MFVSLIQEPTGSNSFSYLSVFYYIFFYYTSVRTLFYVYNCLLLLLLELGDSCESGISVKSYHIFHNTSRFESTDFTRTYNLFVWVFVAPQSASVYIQWLKCVQWSCCAERYWRCQPPSLVFNPTPCDSQPQPESVRREGGGRDRKEKEKE